MPETVCAKWQTNHSRIHLVGHESHVWVQSTSMRVLSVYTIINLKVRIRDSAFCLLLNCSLIDLSLIYMHFVCSIQNIPYWIIGVRK